VAPSNADTPSVKGSLFAITQANLLALIEEGAITRDELEVRLTPEQFGFLDAKVQVAIWYPVDAFNAFVEISAQIKGETSRAALAATGRLAADHLAESGIYAQLDESTTPHGENSGRRLVTLGSAFYNFMQWEYVAGEDSSHFAIHVTDAAAWCEELRYISEGFIEVVSSRSTQRKVQVTSERVAPDHVIFRGRPAD